MPTIPPMTRHHDGVSIRWSLMGLRQIMGQEIAKVTHQSRWRDPLPGTWDEWMTLLELCQKFPRIATWQGPWWLFSDPDVIQMAIAQVPVISPSDPAAVALREAAWFWHALGWGFYAGPTTWAIQSFLMLDAWPHDLWRAVDGILSHPVPDHIRLERRVMFLRVAIESAEAGAATLSWGTGLMDCRPLLLSNGKGEEHERF